MPFRHDGDASKKRIFWALRRGGYEAKAGSRAGYGSRGKQQKGALVSISLRRAFVHTGRNPPKRSKAFTQPRASYLWWHYNDSLPLSPSLSLSLFDTTPRRYTIHPRRSTKPAENQTDQRACPLTFYCANPTTRVVTTHWRSKSSSLQH